MREVQERLNALGYDAGEPDGRLGEITRAGVKQAQQNSACPPTAIRRASCLELLRKGR